MIPENNESVTFSVSALPEVVQQTLRTLGITEMFFTLSQTLATLTEKAPEVLIFFYTLLYQHLITENANHLLVRINQVFDFSALDEVAATYYKDNGLGKPRDFSGQQLVRLLLLRWLLGWPYRVIADRLRYNWLARWFAGFPLVGETPGKSTIQKFEKLLIESHPDLLFTQVCRQIVEAFPLDDWQTQVGDIFPRFSRVLFMTIPQFVCITCHSSNRLCQCRAKTLFRATC